MRRKMTTSFHRVKITQLLITTPLAEKTWDERNWAKKIWKIYRMLCQLEKAKIGGTNFSVKIRDTATYYAVKYRMMD